MTMTMTMTIDHDHDDPDNEEDNVHIILLVSNAAQKRLLCPQERQYQASPPKVEITAMIFETPSSPLITGFSIDCQLIAVLLKE